MTPFKPQVAVAPWAPAALHNHWIGITYPVSWIYFQSPRDSLGAVKTSGVRAVAWSVDTSGISLSQDRSHGYGGEGKMPISLSGDREFEAQAN